MRRILAGVLAVASLAATADDAGRAKARWAQSKHGPMLERILPPTFEAAQLPQPHSAGARLVQRYCVQCHNLPNPAMHDARRWPSVVERMVLRMRGKGNLGVLMAQMMAGVEAPTKEEHRALLAYLRRHAQKVIDPNRIAGFYAREGEAFRLACSQCHVLPDPQRYTAAEWPRVVERMQQNMEWMNRVVGTQPVPGEPQLRIEDINAFLAKYAKRTGRDAAH